MKSELLKEILARYRIARPEEVMGCSPQEIESFEKQAKLEFPGQYKNFLRIIGKGAGDLRIGSNMFFPENINLKKNLKWLMKSDKVNFQLPANSLVFGTHQGYIYYYLDASAGNDSKVYIYSEQDGPPRVICESFSQFWVNEIVESAEFRIKRDLEENEIEEIKKIIHDEFLESKKITANENNQKASQP